MELIKIQVPNDNFLLDNGRMRLTEQQVSHQGIWNIHLSDVDPWPSNPHGDRVDAAEKLNLLTGSVFSTKNRTYLYSLSGKAMRYIYSIIKKGKYEKLIKSLEEQEKDMTYI